MLYILEIYSFLWLSGIPLYGYTNLFIHSPVNVLLGCFQFGATTNKAVLTVSIVGTICFLFSWVSTSNIFSQ